jgi:colicin import membrane protein
MNRLQKKCVIGTAGVHLLLLVILFVGPAFFYSRPKADDMQVLDVIPANLIDAAFNSGVANATPPPPAPVTPPQPPPPVPAKIEPPEPVKETVKAPAPAEKLDAGELRKFQINTQLVARTAPKASPNANDAARARAVRSALRNLKSNLQPGTTIDMPGNSSVAYANYGTVVVSVYRHAWVPPAGMATDNAMMKFTVTIAGDGTVISSRITEPSGDANVDSAVQRMLDRVTFIAPFPEGATEKERTYTMNFNATRRTLE